MTQTTLPGSNRRQAATRPGVLRKARRAVQAACLAAAFALIAQTGVLHAQLNTATLKGESKDGTGAAIPNANVSVKNLDTGVVKVTVTGGQGEFFLPSLQPGMYEITVSHAGFESSRQTGVKLDVGEQASLDFTLPIGNTSETVEVATTLSEIPNTDTTLGTVIEQKQVVDLPLNGRQFSQLIQLEPGVVPIDNSQNAGKAPGFGSSATSPSVNGQTNRSNLFFVDGIIDSNPFFGGFSFSPSVDDIQEFKAASHTDQAEFGQATGAIVSVITRPGGNSFHGSIFEFDRNTIFNTQIRNFNPTPQKKLPYHQNQFGGSIGGPIFRDKLFFFANYEGGRLVTPTPQFSTVPTVAERAGDFSGVLPGGVTPTIYDPTTYDAATHTVQPFQGNKIPTSRINTGLLTYLNAIYPQPNAPLQGGANNLYTTTGTSNFGDQGSIRIDYTLNEKNSFNGRYSENHATVSSASAIEDIFQTGFNGKNLGGNYVHTFTPTTIAQVTVAYNTLNIPQQIVLPVGDQDALFTAAGLGAGFNKNPGLTPFTLVPDMGLLGGSYSGFWNGAGPIGPMAITQVAGSLTKVLGAHALKFGGSFFRTAMYTNFAGNHFDFSNKATWNTACQFGTAATPTCPTYNGSAGDLGAGGDPVASLLLGYPIDATRNLGNTGVNLRQKIVSGFAQDTWTVNRKLSVTYGIRWDYSTPVTEANNRLAVYNIYTKQYQVAKGDTDLPSALPPNVVVNSRNSTTNPNYTYFQPRIGVAYQFTPKTTLRAGVGRSFDVWGLPLQVAQQNRGAWPSGFAQIASGQTLNVAGVSLKPDGTPVTGQNPFFGAGVIPASPLPAGGLGFQDTKWQPASSFQWNAEVQQDFGKIGTFRIGYVGSETEHITINDPYNLAQASTNTTNKNYPDKIFGAPGSILTSVGTGSYQALQTQLSRSFSNGLVYNAAFTWSRSRALAICGTDFNVCVQNPYDLSADRGPTNLDVPLVFSFNTAYQLPFGKGRKYVNSGPAAYIVGGLQVNAIVTARDGTVINPTNAGQGGDTANAGGGNQRYSYNFNPQQGAQHSITNYFNLAGFANPAIGTYGNASLNSLRGPGFQNVDFSLFKEIPFRERVTLQLRAEAFDLFNHPNLQNPAIGTITTTTNSNGTVSTNYGGGFNNITATLPNSNRVLQIAGKLNF